MMQVQKYLNEHGLDKLVDEFSIKVKDYSDRVVLNYSQIDSPRFHPIADECRALILRKDTWEVLARSFDRFYNLNEGVDPNTTSEQRVSGEEIITKPFPFEKAVAMEKIDGSIITFYYDGSQWCAATRSMAFAEGQTAFGRTFKAVFDEAILKTKFLEKLAEGEGIYENFCYVFELVSPETRVVTDYKEPEVYFLGARFIGEEYQEVSQEELDDWALLWDMKRPKRYNVSDMTSVIELAESFPTLEEGLVLVWEQGGFVDVIVSNWRIKCKNSKFVAVAHMRENGSVSPKNVLHLILENEQKEYLGYFPSDKKFFDVVEKEYNEVIQKIESVYNRFKDIEIQKDFAIAIQNAGCKGVSLGTLFSMRKTGKNADELLRQIGAKKLAKALNLKQRFVEIFGNVIDDDE